MATPFHQHEPQMRYLAKYKCQDCGHSWKVKNSKATLKQCEGRGCSAFVAPYKREPINQKVVYQCPQCQTKKDMRCTKSELDQLDQDPPYCTICRTTMIMVSCKDIFMPKRMFGDFNCRKCGHDWKSGNAWEGKSQECLKCGNKVFPDNLRPLRPRLGEKRGEPHKSDLCEMCKEVRAKGLGQSCKDVDPAVLQNLIGGEFGDDDIDEDSESVVTVNSSVISEGSDEDPEDLTLPISDGELTPTEERKLAEDDLVSAIQAMKLDKK